MLLLLRCFTFFENPKKNFYVFAVFHTFSRTMLCVGNIAIGLGDVAYV